MQALLGASITCRALFRVSFHKIPTARTWKEATAVYYAVSVVQHSAARPVHHKREAV